MTKTEQQYEKKLAELREKARQLNALRAGESNPKRQVKIDKMLAKIEKLEERIKDKGVVPVILIVQLLVMLWKLWQELFPKPA